MTTEAAYAKLVVLLSEGREPEEVRTLIAKDLAGELSP
jgi:L-asparaginase